MDVVRGPPADNPIMCALNAQTMMARTDLVQAGGAQYMKVVCARDKKAAQSNTEIGARESSAVE